MPCKPPVHRPPGFRSAAEVKRALDRERPSAARRGYGPRWRRARAAFLARHPLCAACRAQGRVVPATVVDHVVPHRGDQGAVLGRGNWAPSCKPCHDAQDRARGPLGLTSGRPGGGHMSTRKALRDRPGRRAFMPAKFRRGVSGRFLADAAEFPTLAARLESSSLCEVLRMDDLAIAWRPLGELIPYARNPRTH